MFFISCNEQKTDSAIFKIEINAEVLVDDVFKVYYTDLNNKEKFTENKVIRKKVIGKEFCQKIEFSLIKGVFPKKIRIDFGKNKLLNEIHVREIIIRNASDSIVITKETLHRFFHINKYLKWDKDLGFFEIRNIQDKRKPFIVSSQLLMKKIYLEF